jgi:hypothetical protein
MSDKKDQKPIRLLVDTCVWLDLAKDYGQKSLLGALDDMVKRGHVSLILPQLIVDEFNRNKSRLIEDSARGAMSALKRAKDVTIQFAEPKRRMKVLHDLHEIDRKLVNVGDLVADGVVHALEIFAASEILQTTDAVKVRAANRAIEKKAPFHRAKNGMGDAILIETYADAVAAAKPGDRFCFVTHNTKDFSHPTSNNKMPHPDIAGLFSKVKSRYLITLGDALRVVRPKDYFDIMMPHDWPEMPPRSLTEIQKAEEELLDKIWYDRHMVRYHAIREGKIEIVEKESGPDQVRERTIQRDIWEGALKAGAKVRKKYGENNVGPYTKFDWGMMNGKLSALRWVLGDEWDMLDT